MIKRQSYSEVARVLGHLEFAAHAGVVMLFISIYWQKRVPTGTFESKDQGDQPFNHQSGARQDVEVTFLSATDS